MVKPIIFFFVNVGILYVSWSYLDKPRSRGFSRFLTFESILILFLINVNSWFYNPFSLFQIASWVLLIISLYFIIHSVYLLWLIGKPENGFENTTKLVTGGIYRYIRHPMYSSLLFLAWGVFFKGSSLISAVLVIFTTGFLIATAKLEEAENITKFGKDYVKYMNKTKMLIPVLF